MLNCPFCFSSDIKLQEDGDMCNSVHARYYCTNCGGRTDFAFGKTREIAKEEAVRKWNGKRGCEGTWG